MTLNEAINTPEYRELTRFLKKEKLYNTFQHMKYETDKIGRYVIDRIIIDAVGHVGDYSDVVNTITKGRVKVRNHLVISQLWRFYLLEKINKGEFIPEKLNLRDLGLMLRTHIKNNGYRGSFTIKELFKKHGFKSNKEEDKFFTDMLF
jgi:hypothetical protein